MAVWLFILVCIFWVFVLVWAEYRGDARRRWIAKPAASVAFVAVALASGALDSAYGIWVLAALILCLAGDVLLIPSGQKWFLAGMGAFAAGHGAYIAAFVSGEPVVTPVFLAGAAAMAAFAALTLRWLWPHLGAFRAPVALYSAIIAVMVAASFLAAPPGAAAPHALVIAGAVGFAVSDVAVAREKFVAQNFFNRAWGLPLYYGAQLLLAASV